MNYELKETDGIKIAENWRSYPRGYDKGKTIFKNETGDTLTIEGDTDSWRIVMVESDPEMITIEVSPYLGFCGNAYPDFWSRKTDTDDTALKEWEVIAV